MIGVLVNTIAVIIGSSIGLLFKKGISKKITDAVMVGIGLCTVYIGISGSLKGKNTLILVISIVIGSIIGTYFDLDKKINDLGTLIGKKIRTKDNNSPIAEGFVTGSLLFSIGAMTIIGSLNAGLMGDNEMLFTKSVLDLISSSMLSVSLGIGVLFSAIFVFTFEGAIVLMSKFLQPILTNSAIDELTCAGSIIIIGLGLNIIGVTKIKVANYLPAIVVAPILSWVMSIV